MWLRNWLLLRWIRNRPLVHDSLLSLLSNGVGRIGGFIGVIVVAAQYGATNETDIFFLILAVVLFLTNLGQSYLDLWFIPAYLQTKHQSAGKVSTFLGSIIIMLVCTGGVLCIGIDLLGPHAAVMYWRDGPADTVRVAVRLIYEMSPLLILCWMSAAGVALLNAEQLFTAAGMMPSIPWIGSVMFVLYFEPSFGIHALSIGLILGTMCQFAVISIILKHRGVSVSFGSLGFSMVVKLLRGTAPLFMGLSLFSAMPVLDRLLVAFFLPAGNVTALENANRLIQIPWTLATVGYINVFHSWWAKKSSEGNFEVVNISFRKLFAVSCIVFVPISLLLFWKGLPIVEVIFGHGKYSSEAIDATARAFAYYCLGYWAFMLRSTLIRLYSAQQSTAVVTRSGVWDICVHLIAALLLVRAIGIGGIGVATTLGYIASLAYAMFYHHRQNVKGLANRSKEQLGKTLIKNF